MVETVVVMVFGDCGGDGMMTVVMVFGNCDCDRGCSIDDDGYKDEDCGGDGDGYPDDDDEDSG